MSDQDSSNDREGRIRIPGPLYDRWLRRCHREGIDPDNAGAVWLERALRREGSLLSEDTPPFDVDVPDEAEEQEDLRDGDV